MVADVLRHSENVSAGDRTSYFGITVSKNKFKLFHLVVPEGIEPSKVQILSLYAVPFATNPRDRDSNHISTLGAGTGVEPDVFGL